MKVPKRVIKINSVCVCVCVCECVRNVWVCVYVNV
jgi:hypothetical protein